MKQAKKIFTRMCLSNWGGIDHKILEFHEYVNLFSGKSGSGKSTVMDAIQVILYGSFSSGFLNKAADDAKNKRSVMSYLRGEQKDGSANRGGQDFCSVIVLEIYDTGSHAFTCAGIAFEVRRNDSDLKKYQFFSHCGKIPEDEYITKEGYIYSNGDIRRLIDKRAQSSDNRGRQDVNRIYPSKESYRAVLNDVIMGYVDGQRFITMQKNAIALKMTNGTSQFIRDYMFPASSADTIEKISDQLGAYRDIQEKITDLHQRIELLVQVQEAGRKLLAVQSDRMYGSAFMKCVDIQDIEARIAVGEERQQENAKEQEKKEQALELVLQEKRENGEALIQVKADIQSSDLGGKEQHLKDVEEIGKRLADDSKRWRNVLQGLSRWEDDDYVNEYISNPTLNGIALFRKGTVTAEDVQKLQKRLEEEKKNIDDEYESCWQDLRKVREELDEKRELADAMQKGQKPYPENLRKARRQLESRLHDLYGKRIPVYVFADLFDIKEELWKNAIEGRMGRLKFSLITQPQYAHSAAAAFRQMKQFENIDLINSAAIEKANPQAFENSLYESVETSETWADLCLKRYLGHIIKCNSIDELEAVKDGVTPDCYSYSNFIFRHLRRDDYEKRACIGRKVSKAKLEEYQEDIRRLAEAFTELRDRAEHLKAVREFESLWGEPEEIAALSGAQKRLEQTNEEIVRLKQQIAHLRSGKYNELVELQKQLEQKQTELEMAEQQIRLEKEKLKKEEGDISREIKDKKADLEEKRIGYVPNAQLEAEVEEALKKTSGHALKNLWQKRLDAWAEAEQMELENRQNARSIFVRQYPSCGFHGMEKSNEAYEKLLLDYQNDYEPKYQEEFQKQCELIYKSLRDNVIATIHGDIKAAIRHKNEINRLLKRTNFSDSTYQIKIEPARNENGQFYDMLMASELDSKNLEDTGFEGQISFGEDGFYQKYEQQIQLLTEKFMPPRVSDDEKQMERRRKELEQYADYRNYLRFSMYEQVVDADGNVIRENQVDDMAGRDSGGEGQNPKYVALLAGFAMLYMQQSNRDSKIRLVLLDEAFSKMDQERSAVCLKYARQMELQLIVCVPDERLQSLIQNVDCVYGFRRHANRISMMHIDKGQYLKLMEGEE